MSSSGGERVGPVKFIRDRATKNKWLYREVGTNHIGGLYLRKETVESLGNPPGVVLVIQSVPEAPKP